MAYVRYSCRMQEIEVKVAIPNCDALVAALGARGCVFSKVIAQDDTVFAKHSGSIHTFMGNDLFLRLRVQDNGDTIFTAKLDPNRQAADLAKIEHETIVGSRDEMEKILKAMGYQEIVRVKKQRRKVQYGEYELCVDEVEDLGSFMEIEKMVPPEADARAVQEELVEVLVGLGIDMEGRVARGYDILMLEKLGVPAV